MYNNSKNLRKLKPSPFCKFINDFWLNATIKNMNVLLLHPVILEKTNEFGLIINIGKINLNKAHSKFMFSSFNSYINTFFAVIKISLDDLQDVLKKGMQIISWEQFVEYFKNNDDPFYYADYIQYFTFGLSEEFIKNNEHKLQPILTESNVNYLKEILNNLRIYYNYPRYFEQTILPGVNENEKKEIYPIMYKPIDVIIREQNDNSYEKWKDECYDITSLVKIDTIFNYPKTEQGKKEFYQKYFINKLIQYEDYKALFSFFN